MGFVANFMRFGAVQKFWKSVKIWQSYREFQGGNFFWDTVYITVRSKSLPHSVVLHVLLAGVRYCYRNFVRLSHGWSTPKQFNVSKYFLHICVKFTKARPTPPATKMYQAVQFLAIYGLWGILAGVHKITGVKWVDWVWFLALVAPYLGNEGNYGRRLCWDTSITNSPLINMTGSVQ